MLSPCSPGESPAAPRICLIFLGGAGLEPRCSETGLALESCPRSPQALLGIGQVSGDSAVPRISCCDGDSSSRWRPMLHRSLVTEREHWERCLCGLRLLPESSRAGREQGPPQPAPGTGTAGARRKQQLTRMWHHLVAVVTMKGELLSNTQAAHRDPAGLT